MHKMPLLILTDPLHPELFAAALDGQENHSEILLICPLTWY